MSIHDDQSFKAYRFICRFVKNTGRVGGSETILTLFEFRNPYEKMDRPYEGQSQLIPGMAD